MAINVAGAMASDGGQCGKGKARHDDGRYHIAREAGT